MNKSALRKHAVSLGVDEDKLDEALDMEDTKTVFIQLILAALPNGKWSKASLSRPHPQGNSSAAIAPPPNRPQRIPATKLYVGDAGIQVPSAPATSADLVNAGRRIAWPKNFGRKAARRAGQEFIHAFPPGLVQDSGGKLVVSRQHRAGNKLTRVIHGLVQNSSYSDFK